MLPYFPKKYVYKSLWINRICGPPVCAVGSWKCIFFFFFKVSHSGHEVVGEWQCEAWGGESVRCQVGARVVIKMIRRGGRSWRTFIKDEALWLLRGKVAVSSGPTFWGSCHFTQWLISESSAFRVTDSYTLTRPIPLLKHHSSRFDFQSQRDHCRIIYGCSFSPPKLHNWTSAVHWKRRCI